MTKKKKKENKVINFLICKVEMSLPKYFQSNVIILKGAFEKNRKVSTNEFDNNPFYCVCLPRFTWQSWLKYTG